GAVAVAAGDAGLRGEVGLALVDVVDGQRAAGGRVVGGMAGVLLRERVVRDLVVHRHVVGAVDGDGDGLVGGAVGGGGGEAVGHGLAGAELLDGGLAVVGPLAFPTRRSSDLGAVAVAAGDAGLRGEVGLALVDVVDGQRAAGG